MNPSLDQSQGMIDRTFRWFGRHPKWCVAPVLGLGALAGAQLLVYAYAGKLLLPEPFGYLIALALVLATLASLAVALAWWSDGRQASRAAVALDQILTHIERGAHGVIVPPPEWPRPAARAGTPYRSEHARHGDQDPDDDWTQQLFLDPKRLDPPPTGEGSVA